MLESLSSGQDWAKAERLVLTWFNVGLRTGISAKRLK
jgi:hypothetical protein